MRVTGAETCIVGAAGRFPGAHTLDEFWRNLCEGVESISSFSDDELRAAGVSPQLLADPRYVRARGVLDDIALFDAAFFGLTAREAELMDPQQRVFLECAWQALEDAGYGVRPPGARAGVFGSCSLSTYLMHNLYPSGELVDSADVTQIMLGNNRDFLASQVSYRLNLTGPAVAVQSACSSGLVAVHLACQSLLSGECDLALAGGVSIVVPQAMGYLYQKGGIHSPDGHVRAFDAKGEGMVNGEGVGVVVLRRLADALDDGDAVRAVIRGSAINNDGSAKVGFTAPSLTGQVQVIRDAHTLAGIDAESVTYVEAHATGTALGDPIEIAALTEAFRAGEWKRGSCAIGSVKPNIGHLESAAGIASLIKVMLMLQHRSLPPSLHFERPNPEIDFDDGPFYVNTRLRSWPSHGRARRAGVSSFGIGGTNAHLVLEEAPALESVTSKTGRPWQLLVLSAKSERALDRSTAALGQWLRQHPELPLPDVAYTLQIGRATFDHRRTLLATADEPDAAANALETLDRRRLVSGVCARDRRPVVFMFSGQGAQHVGMGQELYEREAPFRETFDRCSALLEPYLGFDLRDCVYAAPGDEATARLTQTSVAQPALFALEYALARLWMSWGVQPDALVGHSLGEYVAACLAGVVSLPDALGLVAARGRMMQTMPPGAMLAVDAREDALAPLLDLGLSLAAVNGPALCVVSGPFDSITRAEELLDAEGVRHRRLRTSHGFHSGLLDPIVEPFAEEVGRVELAAPRIPYVSNVTGTWITPQLAADPRYWSRHLRQPVRFASCIDVLSRHAASIFLEVGPGTTLSTLVLQCHGADGRHLVLSSLPHTRGRSSELETLVRTLGHLWVAGQEVDWSAFHGSERRRRVPLSTYPFERRRYWIDRPGEDAEPRSERRNGARMATKRADVAEWFWRPTWRRTMPPATEPAPGAWLIFADDAGLGDALAQRLAAGLHDASTVVAGARFAELGDSRYAVRPGSREDHIALLCALHTAGMLPRTVVHCWSVTTDVPDGSRAGFDRAQERGFLSLATFAQALHHLGITDELRVLVVSNRLHDVSGAEESAPEIATLLGACKTMPQELSFVHSLSVDVVLPEPGRRQAQLVVDQLIAEAAVPSPDAVVAYRGRQRWVQSFEPMPLAPAAAPPWRRRGVYLIAGGLGRVGLLIAAHLARTVQARLVLLGRSDFPAREAWEDWLAAHDGQDATSRRITELLALEREGAEVMVVRADVADEAAMRSAVGSTEARFGTLDGVIFAAAEAQGPASHRLLATLDRAGAEAQLRPKVEGLYVLDRLLRDRELDICVLCSSIAAVLGGIGLGPYAAANLFMDAFAARVQGAQRTPWLTVDWDVWEDGGSPAREHPRSSIDRYAMAPAEALDALDRAVWHRVSGQIVVSTGDLLSRLRLWVQRAEPEVTVGPRAQTFHPRPDIGTAYVPPRSEAEMIVADAWQTLLGFGPLGIHDNFFELGGHSLLATQVVSLLCTTCEVDLPLRCLFEGPTIADLALAIVRLKAEGVDDETLARLVADVEAEQAPT